MNNRNVILITADSIRGDYCGFLNSAVETTPNMQGLASDSLIFENALAPGPRTLSSVPVSHTGVELPLNEDDMSVYQNRVDRIRTHLSTNETLAEKFREMGYRTLGFTTNPWTSETTGFNQGFDIFEEFENQGQNFFEELLSETRFETPAKFFDQWRHNKVWFSQWPTYYDEIISTINETDEPYFLWVFLLDTHNPYFPHKDDRVESSTNSMYWNMLRGNSAFNQTEGMTTHKNDLDPEVVTKIRFAYRDCIRSVDRFTGQLLDDLEEDDPLVLFHSDHGEAFGEHGTYGHQPTLYEENLHVPMMLLNAEKSGRVKKPVSIASIPTILEKALSSDANPTDVSEEFIYSRTEDNRVSCLRGSRWKFIQSEDSEELYDLQQDPDEKVNLLSSKPDKTSSLRAELENHLENVPSSEIEGSEKIDDDDSVKDRLESLGYIG